MRRQYEENWNNYHSIHSKSDGRHWSWKRSRGYRQNNKNEVQEESVVCEWKKPESVKSKLKDPDKCYLCGYDNRSLMGLFRKYDDLGIICVNNGMYWI